MKLRQYIPTMLFAASALFAVKNLPQSAKEMYAEIRREFVQNSICCYNPNKDFLVSPKTIVYGQG